MRRRKKRQWVVLGLSASAAAMGATIALTPFVVGADRDVTDLSPLAALEGATLDHATAHTESAPEKRRYLRQVARCADEAYLVAHPARCPAPAGEETAAVAADVGAASWQGEEVTAQDTRAVDGEWGPLFPVPSTAIHAITLPTGKILWFSQPKNDPQTNQPVDGAGGNAHLFDPVTGTTRSVPPPDVEYEDATIAPANVWCGGQVQLADGRVLVVGGNLAYPDYPTPVGAGSGFRGAKWVVTFDPWTETWTRHPDMPHGRWYPSLAELPDGRVLILGGWDESGGVQSAGGPNAPADMVNNMDVEVFDPVANTTSVVDELPPLGPGDPQPYPDHRGLGLYPHLFVLPSTMGWGAGGDKVLVAGPLKWDSAVIDTSDWSWNDIGPLSSDRSWGTAWLEPSGPEGPSRVVLLGGTDAAQSAPGDPGTKQPPLRTAETLDLRNAGSTWQADPDLELQTGRSHFNTVILPDGSLFTSGGGYGQKNGSLYADPVYAAELLARGSDGWRTVGSEADARTYHSTAILLPDGRVLSAGDDRDAHIPVAGRTAQIYSPPYLFKGTRPAFTFTPSSVRYDAPFRVAVSGSTAAIDRVVLVRPGAVTHSVDMDQRSIQLTMTRQADGLTLRTPIDASIAPPGYYMLFAIDAQGVPSLASWVRLDPAAPDAPALPAVPDPPVVAPAPAAPPATGPVAPLRLATMSPKVVVRRGTARVTVRLRATRDSRAVVTLSRRPGGRVVATRTVPLRAGRLANPVLSVRRARLGAATRLAVKVVVRGSDGTRATRITTLSLPRP